MTGHLLMVDDQIVRTMAGSIGERFSRCLGSNGRGQFSGWVRVWGDRQESVGSSRGEGRDRGGARSEMAWLNSGDMRWMGIGIKNVIHIHANEND